jgi:hypothetical protein
LELLRVRASLLVGHLWGPLIFGIALAPLLPVRVKRPLIDAINHMFRRLLPPAMREQ